MSEQAAGLAVVVAGLGYRFTARDEPSLADVSFSLPAGTIAVVAGRTGSGKSTLLRALAGLIPHHASGEMSGSVRLFDQDTRSLGTADLAATAGLVLQSPDDQLCTTTVESEIAFGLANLCLPAEEIERRIGSWLDRLGLASLRHQATQTLSGGQKQRLLLASILAMSPRLLLFDEPLAELDATGAAELLDLLDSLRREGFSIIVAEHHLDELLPRADRVLVLDQGRLSADCTRSDPTLPHALDTAGLIVEGADVPFCAGPSNSEDGPCGTTIVRAGSLEMRFPRQVGPLWRRLDFQIRSGQRVAVIGPNGSGKSTLLHVLAGFTRPSAGRIKIESDGAGTVPVALVPQNPDLTLFSATVELELGYGPRQLGVAAAEVDERILAAAASLGLDALLAEPPLALSQGQRLRVALAAALTLRPRLLLLDEPTTGQDPREVQRLLSVIARAVDSGEVGAVVFSTHDLRIASLFATRALLLADGQLLADGPAAEVLADQTLIHHAHLRRLPARPDEISALPSFTATSKIAPGGRP